MEGFDISELEKIAELAEADSSLAWVHIISHLAFLYIISCNELSQLFSIFGEHLRAKKEPRQLKTAKDQKIQSNVYLCIFLNLL